MVKLQKIGKLAPKSAAGVPASRLGIGFEKLDRAVFDPEKAYDKLGKIGVKWVRIQSGWQRTEKEKGVFDFGWLDSIVDNLLSRGMTPWVNLCYGNELYTDLARTSYGAVGCPPVYREEELTAWLNYCTALAVHLKGRVRHFEVWNEPDGNWSWKPNGANATELGNFTKATAKAIKAAVPEAYLIGGVLYAHNATYLNTALQTGMGEVLDAISFHAYTLIESDVLERVRAIRGLLDQYGLNLDIIQGESGAQSSPFGAGALRYADWTPYSQAKALLRHLVTDLSTEVKFASYFSCMDMIEALRGTVGDKASYLKLGLINPLPVKLIKDFAAKVKKLYVIEELDDIIETHCRKIGLDPIGKAEFTYLGEYSQSYLKDKILGEKDEFVTYPENVPVRPPVMCAGCPHRGVFYTLKKLGVMVSGDIGCYTLGAAAPLCAMDTTICMGASVSGLHGFNIARKGEYEHKAVAVIGDSTFIHSGITGLINIAYNASNSTVIVLDNSITGMTGHQNNPANGFNIKGDPASAVSIEAVCHAVGIDRVRVVDPANLAETEAVIKEELAADAPSVIITRRPCALLKTVKHKPPVKVDPDKCRSCKACMRIGCPAISMSTGKAKIDNTLCVGCGLCTQMCKFDAIEE